MALANRAGMLRQALETASFAISKLAEIVREPSSEKNDDLGVIANTLKEAVMTIQYVRSASE